MTADDRYDLAATAQSRRGVRTFDGVETVTRLPVRIYRFRGRPRGTLARLEAAALPGILAVEEDGEETRMVVVLPRAYAPLADPDEPRSQAAAQVGAHGAALAADALRAAHEAGSVHGDLGPHRIWVASGDDLLLEGVGVPWHGAPDRPDARSDVRALAAALLEYGPSLPPRLRNLLRTVANREPGAPATAAELARGLAPYRRRAAEPPAGAEPAGGSTGALSIARRQAAGPAAGRPEAPRDAGSRRVVKDLPPGGVYHAGHTYERDEVDGPHALEDAPSHVRSRSERRPSIPWTLLALLGVAAGIAGASLLGQDRPDPVGREAAGHVVRVTLDPPSSPPLELTVVSSPLGSALAPGTGLGRAPRRIVLDRDGRWVIRGSFGTRTSHEAVVQVPGDDEVVLSLPVATP